MACFLMMTERDFDQLISSMNAGISIVSAGSGWVGIQVHGTVGQTIGQLAAEIRSSFPGTKISNPSEITYLTAFEVSPTLAARWVNSEFGRVINDFGKNEGQQLVAEIVRQEGLNVDNITNDRGVDITASRSGHNFSIEAKCTFSDRSFPEMLGSAYGYKQCSDGWLEAVGVSPDTTHVSGIQINLADETVSFWQRMDSEAKDWRCVCTMPLSNYSLK